MIGFLNILLRLTIWFLLTADLSPANIVYWRLRHPVTAPGAIPVVVPCGTGHGPYGRL